MEPRYDSKEIEPRIYTMWEDSGFFNPDICVEKGVTRSDAKPFTVVMPPPNANGSLHVGHALFITVQDIMIRSARMRGRRALWIPGADHAGFETQIVYEKKLEKEGSPASTWIANSSTRKYWNSASTIRSIWRTKSRSLGASCDWSREKFTLDPDVVKPYPTNIQKNV